MIAYIFFKQSHFSASLYFHCYGQKRVVICKWNNNVFNEKLKEKSIDIIVYCVTNSHQQTYPTK